jgi:hypothetical protein
VQKFEKRSKSFFLVKVGPHEHLFTLLAVMNTNKKGQIKTKTKICVPNSIEEVSRIGRLCTYRFTGWLAYVDSY